MIRLNPYNFVLSTFLKYTYLNRFVLYYFNEFEVFLKYHHLVDSILINHIDKLVDTKQWHKHYLCQYQILSSINLYVIVRSFPTTIQM